MAEKDIRLTDKSVDDVWKESVERQEREGGKGGGVEASPSEKAAEVNFSSFITSLGIQGLIQLGEIQPHESHESKVDLQAARETIDLLMILKEKTRGNLVPKEEEILSYLLSDLQMKFVVRQQAASRQAPT